MKTALIGFSIFSVIVLLVMLGFFSKYNYVTAKLAIKQKELVKVLINMHPMHAKNEIRVGKKYGLKVVNIRYKYGVKPIYYCGISIYNYCMKEAFIQKIGKTNYLQYRNELDSISKCTFAH